MKRYDVIVIGAGDVGLGIVFRAASDGRKVALIDKGNAGGTCINSGCVPSKTLLYTADRITEIREAGRFGVRASIDEIDFRAVMGRMHHAVESGREAIAKSIAETEDLDFLRGQGHFLDGHTLDVSGKKIRGKKIFIASGARPSIPSIKGLEESDYLTNETVLNLDRKPESLIIIGGGYIGLEYAHFFSALGTKVTMIQRGRTLLPSGEPEISELLKTGIGRRVELLLGFDPEEVKQTTEGCVLTTKDTASGDGREVAAEKLMIAAGRRSNADLLRVRAAGIETDERGFVKVNNFLQTNLRHIWAAGDATGRAMFTHAGDKAAEIAWNNATHRKKIRMDFESVPHAVFTCPQVASVGLTEQAAAQDHKILVGRARYADTVMGEAMIEEKGLAKAIVEKKTGRILGFHIIGPHASILIQEVVNVIGRKGGLKELTGGMHIFPALSNIVVETLSNLE